MSDKCVTSRIKRSGTSKEKSLPLEGISVSASKLISFLALPLTRSKVTTIQRLLSIWQVKYIGRKGRSLVLASAAYVIATLRPRFAGLFSAEVGYKRNYDWSCSARKNDDSRAHRRANITLFKCDILPPFFAPFYTRDDVARFWLQQDRSTDDCR